MATYRYTVKRNFLRSPTVRSVILTPDSGVRPLLFEPGQYVALSLHDRLRPTTTRCFSIASSPNDRFNLEVSVRVAGIFTRALERLAPGSAVSLRGPYGSFVLKEKLHPHLVFLAGGIGITPFMSMIRYASELNLPNIIHLIYSCRTQDDIPFLEEITKLSARNPNFHPTFVIGAGDTGRLKGRSVISGRVKDSTLTALGLGKDAGTHYLLCGPGGYLAAMEKLLISRGVPREQIVTESFSQGRGNGLENRWPSNVYALSGVLLMVTGLFVVSKDLLATLPTLTTKNEGEKKTFPRIETIPPTIDTTITQKPTVVRIPNPEIKIIMIPSDQPAPVILPPPTQTPPQVVTPKPPPTPTPTTKPTNPPKTKVS